MGFAYVAIEIGRQPGKSVEGELDALGWHEAYAEDVEHWKSAHRDAPDYLEIESAIDHWQKAGRGKAERERLRKA